MIRRVRPSAYGGDYGSFFSPHKPQVHCAAPPVPHVHDVSSVVFQDERMCAYLAAPVSLEETLKHGGGVRGAGLLALDGFLQVLDPVAALPDLLELPGQDLGAPLPGQTRLLQAQLTHLHVVFA